MKEANTKEQFTYFGNDKGTFTIVYNLNGDDEMICGVERKEPLAKEMTRRLNTVLDEYTASLQKQLDEVNSKLQEAYEGMNNNAYKCTLLAKELDEAREQFKKLEDMIHADQVWLKLSEKEAEIKRLTDVTSNHIADQDEIIAKQEAEIKELKRIMREGLPKH